MQPDAENSILNNMIPGLRRIDGELTPQQNLGAINPNFGTGAIEHTHNCGNCAVANELRHKGYDVEAQPGVGMTSDELAEMFDGARVQKASLLSTTDLINEMIPKIKQDILSWGEGARGAIGGDWANGIEGHWFSANVRNGAVVFDDGQSGKEDVKYLERMKPQSIEYIRLDNLTPNYKVLKAVKNRRP